MFKKERGCRNVKLKKSLKGNVKRMQKFGRTKKQRRKMLCEQMTISFCAEICLSLLPDPLACHLEAIKNAGILSENFFFPLLKIHRYEDEMKKGEDNVASIGWVCLMKMLRSGLSAAVLDRSSWHMLATYSRATRLE